MAEDNGKGAAGNSPAGEKSSGPLLPTVGSPPLSPAEDGLGARQPASPSPGIVAARQTSSRRRGARFGIRRWRNAMLGAWGAGAVALGVIVGMAMGAVMVAPTNSAPSRFADRQTVQQSIEALNKDIAALRTQLAAAETAAAPIVKTTERLSDDSMDITGSIPLPAADAPLPLPRPATMSRPQLVRGWSIRYVRGGFVYVQGQGGIYQVQLGAPLPGLGPVQEVARRDGRWAVLTPKGLIISLHDRRYFERF